MPGPGADRRGSKRVPVNLLVKVKYENIHQFIEHFATNIGKGGMFLQSRKPYPVGTIIDFEIRLRSGQSVLKGRGEVVWARGPETTSPPKPPGVGIKFLKLDPASQKVLERIIRLKQEKQTQASKATSTAEKAPAAAQQPSSGSAEAHGNDEDISIDISLDEHEPEKGGIPKGGVESPVIGIDLGTTNSCAAVVIEGRPRVIPSRKGYLTIPSIVAYNDQGRLLVGHPAKAQMELNPVNTVYGSKRLVGRPYSSPAVQQMKDRFHYEIIPGPRNEAAVRIVGRDFSLQQVAALILAEIRDVARQFLRTEVNRAVITVP
ncbi:MAG: TIGR02266 family protein, partial [Deltaproteobacteria bacterium]